MKRITNSSDPSPSLGSKHSGNSKVDRTKIKDSDLAVGIQSLDDLLLANIVSFLDPLSHMNFLFTNKHHSKTVPLPPPPPAYKVIHVVMRDTSSYNHGWHFYADTVEGVIQGANQILASDERWKQYKVSDEVALYLQWLNFDTTTGKTLLLQYRDKDAFSQCTFESSRNVPSQSSIVFRVPVHCATYTNDECFRGYSVPDNLRDMTGYGEETRRLLIDFRGCCLCLRRNTKKEDFAPDVHLLSMKLYFKGSKAECDAIESNVISRFYFYEERILELPRGGLERCIQCKKYLCGCNFCINVYYRRDGTPAEQRVNTRYAYVHQCGQHWIRGCAQDLYNK